jgi:hypothetical protein
LTRDDGGEAPIPEYGRNAGFGVADWLGIPKGTEGVAFNYDTPIDSASRTLDPLVRGASLMPGLRQVLPPQYRSSTRDFTRSVLNMRSGGSAEMVNFLYESATGKDIYTGGNVKDSTAERLINTFMPLYGKAKSVADKQPGETAQLQLLQALVGFQTMPLTDKQRNQIAYVGAQEAEDAIAKLKAEGIDVPDYADLVRVGLAPDLSAPKDPNKKRRSSEEVYADTVTQIQDARKATGARPLAGFKEQQEAERRKRYI